MNMIWLLLITSLAHADDPQAVDVESIKQRYWAQGEQAELGVVQNRTYSKARKLTLGLTYGTTSSDPFLAITQLGGSFTYHLSEYIGVGVVGMGFFTGKSGALTEFERWSFATANTVAPFNYIGGEVSASLLYGKLSVLGKSIIYYDMYILGGAGRVNKEGGISFAYHAGIGQRFFLSKHWSLKIDYKLLSYNENIIEKINPATQGSIAGNRQNFSHTINLGVDFLFDVNEIFSKKPKINPEGGEVGKP
ncbi:MAG: outer membrane beta-barrel domain-containing protein [Xanthomonadaceae bacterium]|nr:outer membrane beta-barrel domain-containing protein [Xanthomonadaceae bacterium]